jgi:uncharacterized protein (TIGR02186 family)
MKPLAAAFVLMACCGFDAGMAKAEKVVASLSNHRVAITSSFTGQDLVLFGAIEPETARQPLHDTYDVVVTVTGPRQSYRTRRKSRMLGIWVNVDSRRFIDVPSYLAVLANRPFTHLTTAETLRREQIGLDNYLLMQRVGADFADTVHSDPFRAAFVRLENEAGLYNESTTAVTFITPTVFRAAIPLPAQVPTGTYLIDVRLFSGGDLVGRTATSLEIIKAGFEEYIVEAARDHGLLYGLATTMLALLTGWIASVVLRRD